MNFLDGIVETNNRFIDAVKAMNLREEKVYIYGDGAGGENVRKLFAWYGIVSDGMVVNRKYLKENSNTLCLEDVIAREDNPINLIIAFRGYSPENLICYKEKINNVIDMDCWAGVGIEEEGEWSFQWIKQNAQAFQSLYDKLEDDLSRQTFLAYLNQKISFDYKYLETVKQPFQYFDEEINKMTEHEVFVDCGAYDGDSAMDFIRALRRRGYMTYDEIISCEPDPDNYARLKARNLERHTCIQSGVSDKCGVLHFAKGDTSSRCTEDGDLSVEVDTIDNIMAENAGKVTMIKMDIEGAELNALHGAEETIRKHKPLLAVCVYHKREDLLTIPQYVESIVPDYKVYLRAYERTATELVLYAVI